MIQFDGDFDYLLLLGIEPADAVRNPAALADQIKSKKKEWTSQALNPLYQQSARSSLERARQFESLLAEPAALVAYVNSIQQLRAALRGEHEAIVMGLVSLAIGAGKELTAAQRDMLLKEVKAEGLPASMVDEVLKSRTIAVIAAAKPKAPEQVKLPLLTPALDGVVFTEIQKWLRVLSKGSLYELLDLASSTPPPRLVSQAQLLFAHWSKVLPKTNTSTAWEKSLQACLTYLKDPESKNRYDRAVFNLRVEKLVTRIDLVLAGPSFGIDQATDLIRLGVREFGFAESIVEQCLASRMATRQIAAPARQPVVIQVQGQIRCRRCGVWNGNKQPQCRDCGSSLHRKCENPACPGRLLPIDAKACPACGLPILRGHKYRSLLWMADTFLDAGSHHAAMSVLQAATQILAGPAVDDRVTRASRIRALAATAKAQVAAQAWTELTATLKDLLKVAPRATLAGVPPLEKVVQYVSDSTAKMRTVPADSTPVEAAKTYLATLRRWSDCEEAFQKLRQICSRLESDRDPRRAAVLVGKLLEIRPGDPELKATASRLEPIARAAEALETERRAAEREYRTLLQDSKLYAAERVLQTLERMDSPGPPPHGGEGLRRSLAEVQRELVELRRSATDPAQCELVMGRYLDLLTRCRDCREALLAIQALPLESPAAPEGLAIRREGNRRVLSWRAGTAGRKATNYVLQRSITRPGSRQVAPPFQTIYEGTAPSFNDDEVAHGGVILRYMVHAVARGRIEVEGTTIRTFELASSSMVFDGVLIWQEVMNLRSVRRDRALELTWFLPTGARHVLIERWPGGPNDYGLGAINLPATDERRLIDDSLGERMVYTYRISCVYDGPDGEFRTPGVSVTDGLFDEVSRTLDDPQSTAACEPLRSVNP